MSCNKQGLCSFPCALFFFPISQLIPQQMLSVLLAKYIQNMTVSYRLHGYHTDSSHHSLLPGISQQSLRGLPACIFSTTVPSKHSSQSDLVKTQVGLYRSFAHCPPLAVRFTPEQKPQLWLCLSRSYNTLHSPDLLRYTRLSLSSVSASGLLFSLKIFPQVSPCQWFLNWVPHLKGSHFPHLDSACCS